MRRVVPIVILVVGLGCVGVGLYPFVFSQPESKIQSTHQIWDGDVDSTKDWQSTNTKVLAGDTLFISATGNVTWAHDAGEGNNTVGPEGTRYNASTLYPPQNYASSFPYPDAPCGALLMRIGSHIYPLSHNVSVKVIETGVMEFMINDRYGYLKDNSGAFHALVEK